MVSRHAWLSPCRSWDNHSRVVFLSHFLQAPPPLSLPYDKRKKFGSPALTILDLVRPLQSTVAARFGKRRRRLVEQGDHRLVRWILKSASLQCCCCSNGDIISGAISYDPARRIILLFKFLLLIIHRLSSNNSFLTDPRQALVLSFTQIDLSVKELFPLPTLNNNNKNNDGLDYWYIIMCISPGEFVVVVLRI